MRIKFSHYLMELSTLYGSGCMALKHVAFAPASQKQLGSKLRSPLLQRGTMPAQPFSRFFHHTAFARIENPIESERA